MSDDVRFDLKVAGFTLACSCAFIALVAVPLRQPVHFALMWFFLMLGPISGWIEAAARHDLPTALQLLVPATLACAVPAAIYAFTRGSGWLGVTFLAWVASGYLFTIAIWA